MADEILRVTFEFNEQEMRQFKKLLADSDKSAQDLEKSMKKAGDSADDLSAKGGKGMDALVTGVKAFLALGFVNELKNIAIEASKVAAEGEGIRSAFANIAKAGDLKDLRASVNGTVSDLKLMQQAVKAAGSGIGMDKLKVILADVNKIADATGQNFEQLAEVVIKSIGRESVSALGRFGIKVSDTATEVATADKVMAALKVTTQSLGDVSNETAENYGKIAAAQDNLREAFGRLVNSGPFKEIQSTMAQGLTKLVDSLNRLPQDAFAGKTNAMLELEKQTAKDEQERLNEELKRTWAPGQRARIQEELQAQADLELLINTELIKRTADAQTIAYREAIAKRAREFTPAEFFLGNLDDIDPKEVAKDLAPLIKKIRKEIAAEPMLSEEQLLGMGTAMGDPANDELTEWEKLMKRRAEEAEDAKRRMIEAMTYSPIEETTERMKLDFEDMLDDAMAIVNVFNSLDKEGSGAKKFVASLAGIATILGGALQGSSKESDKKTGGGLKIFGKLASLVLMFLNEGGKVPGGGPNRDSVPALLTPGEFVVKRESSKRSALLLDAINAGELDDKILMKLSANPVIRVDQEEVVRAINSIPQVDYFMQASTIYEYRRNASDRRVEIKRRSAL